MPNDMRRQWNGWAIAQLEAEGHRSADTHLVALSLPAYPGLDVYLKDESSHLTGSLKHRLARSLLFYGICSGRIGPGTLLVEASSGSTAVSEAYYARLLGLRFCAVLPRNTSPSKIVAIRRQGGNCHFVDDPADIYREAMRLAEEADGCYLDQFTFAERATDWRGTGNIAESIFRQLGQERFSIPSWIVMSAGTGGTSATIGRHIRYRSLQTRLCVPDVEFSAFYEGWTRRDRAVTVQRASRIEGIGRPRVEASFLPEVVDDMIRVPDVVSIAAAHLLSRLLDRRVGGSTGTNFVGTLWAMNEMRRERRSGSLVTLICDSGDRYADTYFDDRWLAEQGFEIAPYISLMERFLAGDAFAPELILDQPRAHHHIASAEQRTAAI